MPICGYCKKSSDSISDNIAFKIFFGKENGKWKPLSFGLSGQGEPKTICETCYRKILSEFESSIRQWGIEFTTWLQTLKKETP